MIKRVLIAVSLVATSVAVVVLPAAPAQARPYCGVTAECAHYYFSDPAKTQLVGEYIIECGGTVVQWGTTTQYSIDQDTACN